MKTKKRILSMLLALTLCLSLSTTAFASETSEIPENVTKTTVTYTVDAGESITTVQPRMWSGNTYTLNSGTATYTAQFTIPDKYFAYEVYATDSNGNALSSSTTAFYVYLMEDDVETTIASLSGAANGTTYKKDWITVTAGNSYLFKIYNNSSTSLSVTITCYSWV